MLQWLETKSSSFSFSHACSHNFLIGDNMIKSVWSFGGFWSDQMMLFPIFVFRNLNNTENLSVKEVDVAFSKDKHLELSLESCPRDASFKWEPHPP